MIVVALGCDRAWRGRRPAHPELGDGHHQLDTCLIRHRPWRPAAGLLSRFGCDASCVLGRWTRESRARFGLVVTRKFTAGREFGLQMSPIAA